MNFIRNLKSSGGLTVAGAALAGLILAGAFLISSTLFGQSIAYGATGSVNVGQESVGGSGSSSGSTGGGTNGLDKVPPIISNVVVSVTYNSATINWTTNELTLSRVVWGDTPDLRSGTIASEKFTQNHSVLISDLRPQTQYYFSITTIDTSNNQSSYSGEFYTLTPPDITPPLNISRFTATPLLDQIQLTWVNPGDADFNFVRIVRSDRSYPLDPHNGLVVYEGPGNMFIDRNVKTGVIYYYSGFSRDFTGNFASGAVAYTMIPARDDVNQDPGAPVVDIDLPIAPEKFPDLDLFKDFDFTYNGGVSVNPKNPEIPVGASIRLAIPKDSLPADTSYLTLTIWDKDRKTPGSTYLFLYDSKSREYYLDIPPFDSEQSLELEVNIFNSSKQIIQQSRGLLEVVIEIPAEEVIDRPNYSQILLKVLIWILTPGLPLLLWFLVWRRKKNEKQDK